MIPYLPRHDAALGFTALLRFDLGGVQLELIDPLATPTVDLLGRKRPDTAFIKHGE